MSDRIAEIAEFYCPGSPLKCAAAIREAVKEERAAFRQAIKDTGMLLRTERVLLAWLDARDAEEGK